MNAVPREDLFYWRLFATGFSFFTFGLGGLLIRLMVFPIAEMLPATPEKRLVRYRRLIHQTFRQFIAQMRGLGVLTYEIRGIERLNRPGQLVIANHPSLIDIVFLISCVRDANCIVKGSLFHNPFTRGPVTAAGFISNNDPNRMIDECVAGLRKQESLVVFPEGTRSKPGEPLKFHRGAAYIALRARPTVTPVYISCDPPTLGKHQKWYHIPCRRVHFTLRVGDDLPMDGFDTDEPETMKARRLTEYWQSHFSGNSHYETT